MADLLDAVRDVESGLEGLADDERATQMAAYMKDHFPFLGVQATPRRAVQRAATKLAKRAEPDELLHAAGQCWNADPREMQYAGADLLRAGAGNLRPEHLDEVRRFVETKSWWDTVDSLAAHTIGTMVHRHRELSPVMDTWVDDENMWVARTAILHQLAWKHDAEPDRLFDYAKRRASDTEFFIRKALGWSLRSLAHVAPDQVRRFVDDHRDRLSGLTVREATKHL